MAWPGLVPSRAHMLEQHLSRMEMRGVHYSRSAPNRDGQIAMLDDGRGMTGRVIAAALDWLSEFNSAKPEECRADDWFARPTQSQLADAVGESTSGVNRFIAGRPTGATPWHTRGETIIRFLFLGEGERAELCTTESEREDLLGCTERISRWIFRGKKKNDPTPQLFRGPRRYSSAPWTPTELAFEIDWVARHAELTEDNQTQLVFASHSAKFVQEHEAVADATRRAIDAGVRCRFICADMEDSDATGSVSNFLDSLDTGDDVDAPVRVGNGTHGLSGPAMLVPAMQWVLLRYMDERGVPSETLLLVRGKIDSDTEGEDAEASYTIVANTTELRAFDAWLIELESNAPPVRKPNAPSVDDGQADEVIA